MTPSARHQHISTSVFEDDVQHEIQSNPIVLPSTFARYRQLAAVLSDIRYHACSVYMRFSFPWLSPSPSPSPSIPIMFNVQCSMFKSARILLSVRKCIISYHPSTSPFWSPGFTLLLSYGFLVLSSTFHLPPLSFSCSFSMFPFPNNQSTQPRPRSTVHCIIASSIITSLLGTYLLTSSVIGSSCMHCIPSNYHPIKLVCSYTLHVSLSNSFTSYRT